MAPREDGQPLRRHCPQVAATIPRHSGDRAGGHSIRNRRHLKSILVLSRQPSIRPNPKNAFAGFNECANPVSRQAILDCESGDSPVLPARQSFAGSNPERSVPGLKQAANIVARQRWTGVLVEDLEAVAVEADETYLGAQPDEPVFGLNQRLHGVLRKAVLHHPGLAGIVGQRR
jgi:hypothetical protein